MQLVYFWFFVLLYQSLYQLCHLQYNQLISLKLNPKKIELNKLQNQLDSLLDQIENDNISEEVSSSSLDIDKPNEASVRRLSLFDTLSTENKSEDIVVENDILTKTEPVFASSEEKTEENESEDKNTEDNNFNGFSNLVFIQDNEIEISGSVLIEDKNSRIRGKIIKFNMGSGELQIN